MTGPSPDIAILAGIHETVPTQQTRVAAACLQRGLSVVFLVDDARMSLESVRSSYDLPGTSLYPLRARTWRRGPLAYPCAVSVIRLYWSLRRSLKTFAPKVVLTHSDASGVFRAIQHWAKHRGIAGVALQEGAGAERRCGQPPRRRQLRGLGSHLLRRWGPDLLRSKGVYQHADHVLVWGEAFKRILVQGGRPQATVHVTGNPGFDHLRGRAALAPRTRRTVLFAQQHQRNGDVEFQACRHIISVCADQLQCPLLVRPHPRGQLTVNQVQELAAATRHPELITVANRGDLKDYLPKASVFLTYYSASAYDAAIHGIPLVLADWVSSAYFLDAPKYNAALSAEQPEDLAPLLRRALDDEECRLSLYDGAAAWLKDHLGELDGRAAERVATELEHLARRRHPAAVSPVHRSSASLKPITRPVADCLGDGA